MKIATLNIDWARKTGAKKLTGLGLKRPKSPFSPHEGFI